jgi:malonyl-CoA decarboxylase
MKYKVGHALKLGGSANFLSELLQSIAERGRLLLGRARTGEATPSNLAALCDALLSRRGEASGVAIAAEILARYRDLDEAGRIEFLKVLAEGYGPDQARLDAAIQAYQANPGPRTSRSVHAAAEPRRQELIRRLNLAPGGTAGLVRMREELLRQRASVPNFEGLDADFAHLFQSWFNRGFLVLRRIDWTTPANILQKIIDYEAVHEIRDWEDLRGRLEPADRRCFAFFHPQLVDEPLIFVEVALTSAIPGSIAEVLSDKRKPISTDQANTAVFYSISNCQEGLRGISFGNFLIKQVVDELSRELPTLDTFVTLSPAPGFAQWIVEQRAAPRSSALPQDTLSALSRLDEPNWWSDETAVEALGEPVLAAAACYLLRAKNREDKPADPVARFHLGNGARLDRLNWPADLSAKGLRQAHGLMVNYLYDLDEIERNHEEFLETGAIAAAPSVRRALRGMPESPAVATT